MEQKKSLIRSYQNMDEDCKKVSRIFAGQKVQACGFHCIKISWAFCSGIAVSWRCHMALDLVDYILLRAYSHVVGFGPYMFLL